MDKSKLMRLFQSRKFWASVVGTVAMVATVFSTDIPQEQWVDAIMALVAGIAFIVGSFNIGTAIEDAGASKTGRPFRKLGGGIETRGALEKSGGAVHRGRPSKRDGRNSAGNYGQTSG